VFCDKPETSKRIFIGDHYGLWLICNRCIAKAAALIARKWKTVRRKTAQSIEMRQQRRADGQLRPRQKPERLTNIGIRSPNPSSLAGARPSRRDVFLGTKRT